MYRLTVAAPEAHLAVEHALSARRLGADGLEGRRIRGFEVRHRLPDQVVQLGPDDLQRLRVGVAYQAAVSVHEQDCIH